MKNNYDKLIGLLKELFQFDRADLDFGIFRIMNQKRDEITRFLEKDLLPQVKEAFSEYKFADVISFEEELKKTIKYAKQAGYDSEQSPKVKELREKISTYGVDVTALENEVFSHLYNFFRRYYHEGDFLSLRRYKEGVYAIPYEGEEVKLYWANHDQYYIKSSEYLRDYAFKLPSGKPVHFKLTDADVEKDNIKAQTGNERRFILFEENPVEEINGELFIRFEYRPDAEKRKQTDLNIQAVEIVFKQKGIDQWIKELSDLMPTEKNKNRTLLEKHLIDYTARNTFDYFIHKDLGGFLRRELDFYIKNEVMHLDDIEHETVPKVEQYLSRIKVIRKIAGKIIVFLEQLENFQKKLWLKKKFVVETNYCVTLDRVSEELYEEIAANDAQREEWVRLFAINEIKGEIGTEGYAEPLIAKFLKENKFLIVDTRFFDEEFKRKLVGSFEDLDGQCDGLLIHGENFQALNLLQERYRERVKCIYIDPPYNTGNDGFCYRDNYQHSSWLTMLGSRYRLALCLLVENGVIFTSIDDGEHFRLNALQNLIFGNENFISNIIWQKKFSPQNDAKWLSDNHDFITCVAKSKSLWRPNLLPRTEKHNYRYKNPDNDPRGNWASSGLDVKTYAPEYDYPIETPSGRLVDPPGTSCWRYSKEKFKELLKDNRIWFGEDGNNVPRIKRFLSEVKQGITPLTIWEHKDVGHNQEGAQELNKLFAYRIEFTSPKVVRLLKRIIQIGSDNKSYILDFFGGSGTTAHAVININREDNGSRKYILVEMGEYFNTVLKPRIQKVIYSKDWKNGKPVSREGSSHMFKYIRLESYEDTLNNLELKRTDKQEQLLLSNEMSKKAKEEYMLSYMLDVESKGSLLNIDTFEDPFNYKLNIATGSVGETKPTKVDMVETFNYLIGLTVKHIDHIQGFCVVEGVSPQDEKVLIIWRNTKEKSNKDLETFFRKQDYSTRDMEFDLIYVNGDNNLENIRRPDETWKVRLIEEEFKRLMFDVEDV
ncbi:site-specific DNA-methyltransferase [Patescibacteria group bacterium]|nr:site-specific DNA-methyltransferase [Patescibacteria group bacterium]